MNLLERTRQLLADRPRTLGLTTIADGAGLSVHWVKSFSQGRIPDPGVRKVQQLHDYLAARR